MERERKKELKNAGIVKRCWDRKKCWNAGMLECWRCWNGKREEERIKECWDS
jgi:hypothetical protein